MLSFRLFPLFALTTVAALGRAQLIVGSTTPSTTTSGAYYLDLTTDVARQLWVGPGTGNASRKVDGLTADTANGLLYGNDSARLYKWSFGTVGTNPTFVSGFYRPTSTGGGTASGVSSLAYARGALYAYSNFASTTASAGIFRVDTSIVGSATLANMSPVWTQTNNLQYNFAGLDYDPVTGFFYATNTPTSNAPTTATGLYRVDLFASTPSVTKIADFDSSFLTAPDGLTIGNGKLWLSGKPLNSSLLIESYDLRSGAFGDFLSLDLGDSAARTTDLAWAPGALSPVPEPTTFLAMGLSLTALAVRRRRKSIRL